MTSVLAEKSINDHVEFWRIKCGLHPVETPQGVFRETDRQIRCDILPVPEQIRLCQQRIKQQRWMIADIKKIKGDGGIKSKGISLARNAIAFEKQRISGLIYSQIPESKRLFFEQTRRKLGLAQALNLTVDIPTDP